MARAGHGGAHEVGPSGRGGVPVLRASVGTGAMARPFPREQDHGQCAVVGGRSDRGAPESGAPGHRRGRSLRRARSGADPGGVRGGGAPRERRPAGRWGTDPRHGSGRVVRGTDRPVARVLGLVVLVQPRPATAERRVPADRPRPPRARLLGHARGRVRDGLPGGGRGGRHGRARDRERDGAGAFPGQLRGTTGRGPSSAPGRAARAGRIGDALRGGAGDRRARGGGARAPGPGARRVRARLPGQAPSTGRCRRRSWRRWSRRA